MKGERVAQPPLGRMAKAALWSCNWRMVGRLESKPCNARRVRIHRSEPAPVLSLGCHLFFMVRRFLGMRSGLLTGRCLLAWCGLLTRCSLLARCRLLTWSGLFTWSGLLTRGLCTRCRLLTRSRLFARRSLLTRCSRLMRSCLLAWSRLGVGCRTLCARLACLPRLGIRLSIGMLRWSAARTLRTGLALRLCGGLAL